MTISVDLLTTELVEHLGTDSIDLPNANAELLLNRAFWELLNKFPFREEECSTDFTVSDTEDFIDLPSLFEAMRTLSIMDAATNKWTPLIRIDIQEFDRLTDDDTTAKGAPVKYFREGTGIRLLSEAGGAPDADYTMRIKHRVTLADLGSGDTPSIPSVWHELILFGGFWRGLIRQGRDKKAREIRNIQIGMISSTVPVEAKEEADSPLAGIEIPLELTQI